MTKEEVTKELYNQEELRRTITITLKGRDLKASATIAGRRVTCPKKKSVESNVESSNMEMEEDWDAKVLYAIEEDELALMAMMGDHIDYENDWIID